MRLFRRPVSITVFAIFLSIGLWFWLKGAALIEDFNRVAYAPLWTGEVDLSSQASFTATFDNSFPAGHGMWLRLEALDATETTSEDAASVPCVNATIEREPRAEPEVVPLLPIETMGFEAGLLAEHATIEGPEFQGTWEGSPWVSPLKLNITLEPVTSDLASGVRRIEIWAGVCGLEMLGGRMLQALGAASGIVALVAGITGLRPRKPQSQTMNGAPTAL